MKLLWFSPPYSYPYNAYSVCSLNLQSTNGCFKIEQQQWFRPPMSNLLVSYVDRTAKGGASNQSNLPF
jgi:hypothetical protein